MLTFEQIKELIELVARHRLSGVELDRSGFRLKIDGYQAAVETAPAGAPLPALQALPAAPPGALLAGAAPAPLAALPPAAGAAGGALAGTAPGQPGGPAPVPGAGAAPSPASGAAAAGAPAGTPAGAMAREGLHVLDSPIVGTFYRAASPEAPPFVEVGARVRKGQVVCIIEAMKLMNEIESDVNGTVVEVYPQNAQAVEFGEPLFAINTSS